MSAQSREVTADPVENWEGEGGKGEAGKGVEGVGEFADFNEVDWEERGGAAEGGSKGDVRHLLVIKGGAESFGDLRRKSLVGGGGIPPPRPLGLIWEQPHQKSRKRRVQLYRRAKRSVPPLCVQNSELADSDSPSSQSLGSDGEIQTRELEEARVAPAEGEGSRSPPNAAAMEMKAGEKDEASVTLEQLEGMFSSFTTHFEPEPEQPVKVVPIEPSSSASEERIREEDDKQFYKSSSLGECEIFSDSPTEDLENADEEDSTEASEDDEDDERLPLVYTCPFCELEYREREQLIFHLPSHERYRRIMNMQEKQQRKITVDLEEENPPSVLIKTPTPQPQAFNFPVANSRLYKMKNSFLKLFMCRNCNTPFKNLLRLRAHVARLHDASTAWKCFECDLRFLTLRHLKLHKRQVHSTANRCNGSDRNLLPSSGRGRNKVHVTPSTFKLRPCKVLLTRCDRSLDRKKSSVICKGDRIVSPSTIKLRPCVVRVTRCDHLIPAHRRQNKASVPVPVKSVEGTNFEHETKRG